MWWTEPLGNAVLGAVVSALFTAVLGYAVLRHKLRTIRLEGQLEARKEAQEVFVVLETYKLATVQADKEIAAVLATTTQAQQSANAVMMQHLGELTHLVVNMTTALARIERTQANQSRLFTARAMTAAAIVALQTMKDVARKELEEERAKHAPQE